MKRAYLPFVLCLALASAAIAQPITTTAGSKSDEIFLKLKKIDLLNQLVPLQLTKKQINDDLLPAVEKARARQKLVLAEEDKELEKLDPEVSAVIKNALEKNQFPPKDFLTRVADKTREMSMKRNLALTQMTEDVSKVLDASFTEGQKKIMEGSFDEAFIDSTKKPGEIPPDAKRAFFIRTVFLDTLTRELLIEMAKYAK